MLYRVSGRLNNGETFSGHIEAPDATAAIGQIRASFTESQPPVALTDIARIASQPVKGGKTIRFGKAREGKKGKTPAAPAKK